MRGSFSSSSVRTNWRGGLAVSEAPKVSLVSMSEAEVVATVAGAKPLFSELNLGVTCLAFPLCAIKAACGVEGIDS